MISKAPRVCALGALSAQVWHTPTMRRLTVKRMIDHLTALVSSCLKAFASFLAGALLTASWGAAEPLSPERVTFVSADSKTTLVGFVFKPARIAGQHPAIVLIHGRAGAYSGEAKGIYDSSTLSPRHTAWGRIWAEAGYLAILVDGFGPRGYPQGFPRFSYEDRPAELDETMIRPRDAYGALGYLRSRSDVVPEQIGLMGWSNGGSAVLVAMAPEWRPSAGGFRAALAFYPGCRLKGRFDNAPLRPYAPMLILHGTDDEEVSHEHCLDLIEASQASKGALDIRLFDGATHSFDSPTRSRQSLPPNANAREEAISAALAFFTTHLEGESSPNQHGGKKKR